LQHLCEIRTPYAGAKIPQNARAIAKPSDRTFEAGDTLSRKDVEGTLYVYRPQYHFQLDGLQITWWVTDQWPDGAVAWCDVQLEVNDPVGLLSELGSESGDADTGTAVPIKAVEDWMRPRIIELLDRLENHGQLTSEAYWPTVPAQVIEGLNLPSGVRLGRFVLRKVRTLDQSVAEQRLKEDYQARLQQAIDDGTLKHLASQGRIDEFVTGLESDVSADILTAAERQQDAIGRLTAYVEILGVNRERFEEQTMALHSESYWIHGHPPEHLCLFECNRGDLFEKP